MKETLKHWFSELSLEELRELREFDYKGCMDEIISDFEVSRSCEHCGKIRGEKSWSLTIVEGNDARSKFHADKRFCSRNCLNNNFRENCL